MRYRLPLLIGGVAGFAGILLALTGGPTDQSGSISPLPADSTVTVQTDERGLVHSLTPATGFEAFGRHAPTRSFHPDALYLETVLSYGTTTDPRAIFSLVNAYLNANQHEIGLAFFERLMTRYAESTDDRTKAYHLAAYAILRATHAEAVPLLSRIGWVTDTFDLLEQATALAGPDDPLVRWASGLIYARVPFFFFKKEEAYRDLTWLAERPETEPVSGFYREVYAALSDLHDSDGNSEEAARYRALSGYREYRPRSLFMGWFTSTPAGAAMQAEPRIEEIEEGRIFALYGFGFSESYIVIAADRSRSFLIDALARPDQLERALTAFSAAVPDAPPITDVFVTHAHWDHIAGLPHLLAGNPDIEIHGRDNFHGVVARVDRDHSYDHFRGEGFQSGWVRSYEPTRPVIHGRSWKLGGTRIDLIPIQGGETEDALLIHFPDLDTVFVGDFLMPYYGEPWVEEGDIPGAVQAMDTVLDLDATHVLHGHYPLNFLYPTEKLGPYRDAFAWLAEATAKHIEHGYSVAEILRLNLIPPQLLDEPETHLSYLSPRDHVIARIADQMTGFWQEETSGEFPTGLTSLTVEEYGNLLQTYLGLSERAVRNGIEAMLNAGDNALALHIAVTAERQYGSNPDLTELKETAADRLRASAQFFDPFEMITMTEIIDRAHPHVRGEDQ